MSDIGKWSFYKFRSHPNKSDDFYCHILALPFFKQIFIFGFNVSESHSELCMSVAIVSLLKTSIQSKTQ